MFKLLERQFQRRAELLLLGRFADLTVHCQFPFQMQFCDRTVMIHSAEDYVKWMGRLRDGLIEKGVQVLVAEVSAVEMPTAGGFRIWVSWEAMTSAMDDPVSYPSIYHGVVQDGFFISRKAEYLGVGLVELMALAPRLAKSA